MIYEYMWAVAEGEYKKKRTHIAHRPQLQYHAHFILVPLTSITYRHADISIQNGF